MLFYILFVSWNSSKETVIPGLCWVYWKVNEIIYFMWWHIFNMGSISFKVLWKKTTTLKPQSFKNSHQNSFSLNAIVSSNGEISLRSVFSTHFLFCMFFHIPLMKLQQFIEEKKIKLKYHFNDSGININFDRSEKCSQCVAAKYILSY